MDNIEQQFALINYWRTSLVDGDNLDLSARAKQGNVEFVHRDILEKDLIPDQHLLKYFQRAEQAIKNKTNEDVELATLDVLVAPIVAQRKYSHGVQTQSYNKEYPAIFPLVITAKVSRSGKLKVYQEGGKVILPRITRGFLEPTEKDTVVLGSIKDADVFVVENGMDDTEDPDWGELWQYGFKLLNTLSRNDWQQRLEKANYQLIESGAVFIGEYRSNINASIVAFYDYLLTKQEQKASFTWPKLLQRYCAWQNAELKPLLDDTAICRYSKKHEGYFSQFPLTKTQRVALSHFLSLPNGEMLAINGQPGTGKTTLLQSIIASLWTKAALDEAEPPIILASSTNN